jgi:hypothetical protein
MDMNRNKLFTLLAALAVLLILGTVLGLHRVYDWSFGFIAMPPTDEELRQWLASQPGVEGVEIWRERTRRGDVQVTVSSSDQPGVGRTEVKPWEVDELRIRFRVRIWRRAPDDMSPPWERLGYKGFRGLAGPPYGGPHSAAKTSYMGWGW